MDRRFQGLMDVASVRAPILEGWGRSRGRKESPA